LLDEVVDAFAAGDSATVFGAVDRVVETGLDPKGFLTDLLQRFRDLVIVAAVPDAFESGLVPVAADQRERMTAQATRLGLPALTRAADLVAVGLTELRGATAPRLQLELVCAKILLPGAHGDESGLAVRLDRLERHLAIAGAPSAPAPASAPVAAPAPPSPPTAAVAAQPPSEAQPAEAQAEAAPAEAAPVESAPADAVPRAGAAATAATAGGSPDLHEVRLMWPSVLDRVKDTRRVSWLVLFEKADIVGVDDSGVTLAFPNVGDPKGFFAGGHADVLRQALIDVLGVDWQVEAIHDPSAGGARAATSVTPPASTAAAPTQMPTQAPTAPPHHDESHVVAESVDDDSDQSAGHDLVAQQLGGTVIGEIEH
jgi:DNA polymerase-3 subunit gamma/tau